MDIKQLKKLINEELERKNLQEQPEMQKAIYPEDVLLTLILKNDSLPLEENSAVNSAISNIDMKINLARSRLATLNSYVPHDARELTMQEVYSSMKSDPKIMDYILKFLHSMGGTESLISNFKNKALVELEKFNTQQPKTNPGTPSSKMQEPPVDPSAKTKPPSSVGGTSNKPNSPSQNPMTKALSKARGSRRK